MSTDSAAKGCDPDEQDLAGKDPLDVLRATLAIKPEDAKQARDKAAAKGAEKKAPPN